MKTKYQARVSNACKRYDAVRRTIFLARLYQAEGLIVLLSTYGTIANAVRVTNMLPPSAEVVRTGQS